MAYSIDYRQRVLKYKAKENLTFAETSKLFGVSSRTLFRWVNKLEPCTARNKPASKIDMQALARDFQRYPDAYLSERAQLLGTSVSAVHYALKRLGISRKKNFTVS